MVIERFSSSNEKEEIGRIIKSLCEPISKIYNYKCDITGNFCAVSFSFSMSFNDENDRFDRFLEFCSFWKNCNSKSWSVYNFSNTLKFLIIIEPEVFLEELRTFSDSKKYNL